MESARTISNPVAFSIDILSDGYDLQFLLALGVFRIGKGGVRLLLLVLVVNDSPRPVDEVLYLGTVAQL